MAIETSTAASPPSAPLEPAETPQEDKGEQEEREPKRKPLRKNASAKERLVAWIDEPNIADFVDDAELDKLGMLVTREFSIDENSRSDWLDKTEQAMRFASQDTQPKTFPWPGSCLSLDTDILTRTGWKPIAEVRIGEEVLSRASDGAADYYPVTQTFRHKAPEVVHFSGKSIDLMVTPNHRMLVEDRDTGESSFIEAGDFLRKRWFGPNGRNISRQSIPLTSTWRGEVPGKVYGIDARAYVRFLGWYVSEGSAFYGHNVRELKSGEVADYGTSGSSFSIAQSKRVNPQKYEQIRQDIEACGFTYKEYENCFIVHARSMPALLKAELRGMGKVYGKRLPTHVMNFGAPLLAELIDTMVAGDGHTRQRSHQRAVQRTYYTASHLLADQVQEICQKLGLRGTISVREARAGGVIRGRAITNTVEGYTIAINAKAAIQVLKLHREMVPFDDDVACVEVLPHHTIYVRRNGKAVWCGNSNILFPLITTASIQFAARTYPAIIQNRNVVRGTVWGSDKGTPATEDGKPLGTPKMGPDGKPVWLSAPGEKRLRADRVGEHMSWQLLEEMEDWEEQFDAMLHQLPIIGGAVKKTYFDPVDEENCSELVSLTKLVWNFHAKSFAGAPRHTEIQEYYPTEIMDNEGAEIWLHHEYGPAVEGEGADGGDEDAPHEFLEQHRRYDLDEDGYPEPYVVTVHKRSSKVVRIAARYKEEDILERKDGTIRKITPTQFYTLIPFMPDPNGGSYPIGFGQLLRPMNEAINTTINQMFDAGTLQNAGGGFIGTSLSLHAGPVEFKVGKYIPVNNKGQSIREAVYPMQFPGPSSVLFQMLGLLLTAAKEVASTQDILSGDANMANASPTTLLALIEQGQKLYTAIYKRLYRAMKCEFGKLFDLNRRYLTEEQRYKIGDEWREISPDDYRLGGGVEPVADPTMVTDMQKLGRAAVLMTLKDDPSMNHVELLRRFLDSAQIERIDELLITQPPPEMLAAAQLEMAAKQAELGRTRAAEMKDQTQAFLNLALARSKASAPEEAFIEKQLDFLRLHIEALNTTVKAATIDHRFHDTKMRQVSDEARNAARQQPVEPTPGPTGPFPVPPGPALGADGSGVPAVSAPPDNGGVPAIPGGSGAGLPGPSGGQMAGGQP